MSKPEITYKLINDELNNIFLNTDDSIRKTIENEFKITTRKTVVSYDTTLIYSLLYTDKNITKNEVVNILNEIENTKIYKRTTLYEKEIKIPFSFYSELFKKLYDLYISLFSSENLYKIIDIDGCYTNSNVYNIKQFLETSLNMGFYDVTNDIPLDLTFEGIKNKNKELEVLINYINKNKNYFNNLIIVADRAYCSYKFINYLNKNKIKFVIRFRNNCKNFSKIEKNNYRTINNIISYTDVVNNQHIDDYLIDNKHFSNVTIKYKDEYNIITNLDKSYTDDKIFEIYKSRWSVEVFFKIVKKNFKFEDLRITNNNDDSTYYSIHNLKILIIYLINSITVKAHTIINKVKDTETIKKRKFNKRTILNNDSKFIQRITFKKKYKKKKELPIINLTIKDNPNVIINKKINDDKTKKSINEIKETKNNNEIIEKTKETKNKNEIIENIKETKNNNEIIEKTKETINNNEIKNCSNKPNKSLSIKGTYKLIYYIIKSKLTVEKIKNNCELYITYVKNELNLKKKRICKTPFKKWYVKGYTNKSDILKIVYFLLGFKNDVNKNLKTLSKKYKIIDILFIDDN